jgi:DnaK suppressor protein
MSGLLKKEKESLENQIREKIDVLKEDILSYQNLIRPISPDNAIGRITRMEAISSKSINEEALRKAESTLFQLESALNMIDDSDFGLCKECEEPIPIARLMVIPETYFCVECASKKDL